MTCITYFRDVLVLTETNAYPNMPLMDYAAHSDVTLAHDVQEMMCAVFGEVPGLLQLDVRQEIRQLNARLRGRSEIAARRRNADQIGQSNAHAHLTRLGRLVGSAARGLSARWWRWCRIELGLASGLLGCALVSPPAEALCRVGVAIVAHARRAVSSARKARERARNHAVNYVHHFPTRAATARAAALVLPTAAS